MTTLGQLRIKEPIEKAIREIRNWLDKLKISGLSINTNYDARMNIALLRFNYNGQDYEFISKKQSNCRLNMWAIARAMESKVRNHIMGIEDFGTSMTAYLRLENKSNYTSPDTPTTVKEKNYVILGVSPLASNQELEAKYKVLVKSFHPDMALSLEAKNEFEKRISEINNAWSEIKKERGI
jgi:DnaJ-domain-containing protein 1